MPASPKWAARENTRENKRKMAYRMANGYMIPGVHGPGRIRDSVMDRGILDGKILDAKILDHRILDILTIASGQTV